MNDHSTTLQNEYQKTFRKNHELEALLDVLAKEARKALTITGAWQQDFHDNEILGVIAIYTATRKVLAQKEAALSVAIEFIGSIENHETLGEEAIKSLQKINFAIAGETLEQSIIKQKVN